MSELLNIVTIGASMADQSLVNKLASTLPATDSILLIDALGFSFWSGLQWQSGLPLSLVSSIRPSKVRRFAMNASF